MRHRQIIAVLALAGLFVSLYLWFWKIGVIGTLQCGTGGCEQVQTSRYADLLGVPVAFFGVAGYAALLATSLAGLGPRLVTRREPAVILFVLDVGFRRIQIEREDWLKFVAAVKGTLFFWQPAPKVTKSDESLSALLQRRDAVRAETTKPAEERPELFQPTQPINLPLPGTEPKPEAAKPVSEVAPAEGEKKPESGMASLLEAKRRAQKKK